jgi:hypothetical protein
MEQKGPQLLSHFKERFGMTNCAAPCPNFVSQVVTEYGLSWKAILQCAPTALNYDYQMT